MPGRTAPSRAAAQKARLNQARDILRGKKTKKQREGQIERDDSDDELGDDDIPWTWVYADTTGPLSPVTVNSAPAPEEEKSESKKRLRDGTLVSKISNPSAKPIGAKCGSFECRLGDCLLLKAEGYKAAWVGLAVDFDMDDGDMRALIMWFSTHSEIRNKSKKRTDYIDNEVYITPSYDWNPIESINGKAEILSEKAFKAQFPNGLAKNSKKRGKVFLCRRACDVRPARYSEEFNWDDFYLGQNTDLERLQNWVKENTSARGRRKPKDVDFEMHVDETENDDEYDEDISDEEGVAPRTPRKKRRKLATTPSKPKITPRKLLTPGNRKITAKKALTFTPLSMRTLSPATALSTPYQIARNRLHVSSVPASLPCRENEFSTVYTHLHDAITTGSGSCIYISGTPGTGKTATVREVISQLHYQVQEDELEDFIFLEINGMKITDPHQSYSLLWEAIQGDADDAPARVAPGHALTLLEREFATPSPRRVPIVVLMDELDQLVTKNQSVMYNFFNWPSMTHSRLIVLAVANTMDLPERTLSNKISSRLGLTRITFPGYTHDQLMKIIQSRLEGVPGDIVDKDAVQFAARKVAAVSGDARRALDICRRAVEIVEQSNADKTPATPSKSGKGKEKPVADKSGKVTIQTIMKAINESTSSPLQMYLRHLPMSAKVLLAAILGRIRRSGVNENIMADVIEDAERLVRMAPKASIADVLLSRDTSAGRARPQIDGTEENIFMTPRKKGAQQAWKPGDEDLPRVKGLVSAARELAEGGIIGLEMGRRGERAGRVRLNIGEDEVKAALKDDDDVGGMGFNG